MEAGSSSSFCLIDESYDKLHRARFMVEEQRVFEQLHLRSGGVHGKMNYDERYTNSFAHKMNYDEQKQNELSKHVNEAGEALKYPPGDESNRALKAFAERSKSWARGLGALLGCRFSDDVAPTASRPSSSAAHGSLEDNEEEEPADKEGEEDEGHTHEQMNTSQIPDAPQPSQQQCYSFKARKRREYSKDDIFTPDAYQNKKAAKDPVIEEEVSEELEPLRIQRRVDVAKKKKKSTDGNKKKVKGKK